VQIRPLHLTRHRYLTRPDQLTCHGYLTRWRVWNPSGIDDGIPSYPGMPGKAVLFRAFYGLRLAIRGSRFPGRRL